MATRIVAPGGAFPRASRATPSQHHCAAHNALTLALLYLGRGDLPAARRKAIQALASMRQLQEVSHG
ncbi:hypothetical protein D3C87_782670 [compost metagenome]